jgi:LmbE family N-acetylglucosaminyl deacetylase
MLNFIAYDVNQYRFRLGALRAGGMAYSARFSAGVAELADAPDSKSGSRKGVWVRSPPPADFLKVKLSRSAAEVFVPDGTAEDLALARTTHLGIGAHQDDLEFMAFHGITECFERKDRWFGGVICTNGAGSARSGEYATLSDAEMATLRHEEQKEAARIGQYGAMIQLGYTSTEVKDRGEVRLREDLRAILETTKPEVIYTHNLADKHPTHIAIALAVIDALRALPVEARPRRVIGCEVWRDLDWMPDRDKVIMDVSGHDQLAGELASCFRSQTAAGKRYDLAVAGRRAAHATFGDPHSADQASQVIYGMDLTPLMGNADDPLEYVDAMLGRFASEVRAALRG